MIANVRPFFGKLGIALFGPNPKEEERRERQEQIRILQGVVDRAADFEALSTSRPFQAWHALAQMRMRELEKQLRTAKAEEFSETQARVLAFEEAINIVPTVIAQANAARDEIERLQADGLS